MTKEAYTSKFNIYLSIECFVNNDLFEKSNTGRGVHFIKKYLQTKSMQLNITSLWCHYKLLPTYRDKRHSPVRTGRREDTSSCTSSTRRGRGTRSGTPPRGSRRDTFQRARARRVDDRGEGTHGQWLNGRHWSWLKWFTEGILLPDALTGSGLSGSNCLLFQLSSPLKGILQGLGLLEDGLEVVVDVRGCHGRMDVDLVEGGFELGREYSVE